MQLPSPEALALWPTPNYVDPETRNTALLTIYSIILVLNTVVVALRIFSRCYITHGFGVDDTLIVLAYFHCMAFCAAGMAGVIQMQWGRHTWDVQFRYFVPGIKLNLAMLIVFDAATSLVKTSMLALFMRITRASGHQTARRIAMGLIVLVVLNGIVFFLVNVLQCRPLRYYWTLSQDDSLHCINQTNHLLAAGTLNTIGDLVIAVVFPIPFWLTVANAAASMKTPPASGLSATSSRGHTWYRLSGTHIKRHTGFRWPPPIVSFLFVGGLCIVAAGTARTVFTWRVMTSANADWIWHSNSALASTAAEQTISIAVASLPALRPIFLRVLPHLQAMQLFGGRDAAAAAAAATAASSTLQQEHPSLQKPRPAVRRGEFDEDADSQDGLTITPLELERPTRPAPWGTHYEMHADPDGFIAMPKPASVDVPMNTRSAPGL